MAQKDKNGLTAKQEKYCQERANGKTQRQAYIAAFDDHGGTPETKDCNAYQLETNTQVSHRIEQLRERTRQGNIYDRDAITALLAEIIEDTDAGRTTRLKALDMLNRMQGSYTERKDITVNGLTREDRQNAMQAALEELKKQW